MKPGKISDSILKRSVLKQIKTKNHMVVSGAGLGEDCAIFSIADSEYIATAITQGVLEEIEDIQSLIYKVSNNLATAGADGFAISMSILLPKKVREIKLKQLMEIAELTCENLEMEIVGGHTSVSNKIDAFVVTITGYGKIVDRYYTTKGIHHGQQIVVSKWIGMEGAAILARKERDKLLTRYPEYIINHVESLRNQVSIKKEAATAIKSGVYAMHDASEGGIFAALWELAEASSVGLTIDLKKLPMKQEIIEVCEFCNVNPYELLAGGSLLMVIDQGDDLVKELHQIGINATIIGTITQGNDRIILNGEERRFLDKPKPDEIYQFY